ncbi:MAG TPA: hypothetical protein VHY20_15775 [Pirellulales bacterium]|nr:hypothetical protein [Pirellulales bacterium]
MHFALQIAQVLLLAFAGLTLLVGIGKSLESTERRGSNEQCFYALAAILLDLLLMLAAWLGVRFMAQPVSMAIIAAAFFLAAALAVVAWILSVVGLLQCLVDRGRVYKNGKLAGSLAFLLCTAASAGLAWVAWDVTRDGVPASMVLYHSSKAHVQASAAPDAAGSQTSPQASEAQALEDLAPTPPMDPATADALAKQWTQWFREMPLFNRDLAFVYLRDYNLRYHVPPAHWVREKPRTEHHELLALQHTELPIRFDFSVQQVNSDFRLSTASLLPWIQAGYTDPVTGAIVLADRKVIVNGISGRRLDLSYRVNGQFYTQSCWQTASDGYLIRMSVTADANHISTTLAAATQLFTGLSPIHRQPRAEVAGPAAKPASTDGPSGRRS